MTWKELKDFCNSLPKNQLNNKVILCTEYEAISNIFTEILKKDLYISDGDECCYPMSDAGLNIKDIKRLKLNKIYSKGDAVLFESI